MILWSVYWLQYLSDGLGFLRVLQYLTVRSAGALLFAFLLSLLIGPILIDVLKRLKAGQPIRKSVGEDVRDLSEMHGGKRDTPTMGGLLILFSLLSAMLLFCDLSSSLTWLMLVMALGFGGLGFADDYLKLRHKNSKGLPAKYKLLGQALLGAYLCGHLWLDGMGTHYQYKLPGGAIVATQGYGFLGVPFLKSVYPLLGFFYLPFVVLVLCATSNAVNLTDGLDGLAIGVTTICALAFILITYLLGRVDFANYLLLPHVPAAGDLTVMLSALVGASLGFLWFNSHPAQLFMGDTGSLALGGLLGATAVIMQQELLLIIIGGIFVIEELSVVMQVTSYKLTGRRIFRMSPLHHHFERGGMHESKIIIRFWIVALLLALIGLGTLKLR